VGQEPARDVPGEDVVTDVGILASIRTTVKRRAALAATPLLGRPLLTVAARFAFRRRPMRSRRGRADPLGLGQPPLKARRSPPAQWIVRLLAPSAPRQSNRRVPISSGRMDGYTVGRGLP
jgi:hypothetical protein